jgi:hypothetical protein
MALINKAYLGTIKLFREKSWFEDMSQKPIDASSAVTVTANASAHTKGAWSELVASTSGNASFLVIRVTGIFSNNVNTATLLDIGTGASGSETALISDIAVGGAQDVPIHIPIKIASGTRIAARIQSVVTGGKTATAQIWTFDMGDYAHAPTAVDVIGTSTATSRGTAMSGSSGTWVQITASSANAYRAVCLVPCTNGGAASVLLTEFRFGTGASASESEVGRTFVDFTNSESALSPGILSPLMPGSIASGTRLSVRHDFAITPSSYEVCLIGIR